MKLKFTIAYDGAAYSGWQVQKIGLGVQQRMEEAIAKIFPGAGRLKSSSRTDTGVHAIGMVADLEIPDAEFKMPIWKVGLAINAHLPEDIRVMNVVECDANFDARFDAKGKQYRYFVWSGPAMNPLLRHTAWHVRHQLDVPAMRSAAKFFLGRHDFKSLAGTRDYEMDSTTRTLTRCDLRRTGALLTFIIEGDGVLYKMCRGIAGTLVQVGEGKIPPAAIKEILEKKDRCAAGMTAPAHGLVLWKVFY